MSEYEGKYDRRLLARFRELEAKLKAAEEWKAEAVGVMKLCDFYGLNEADPEKAEQAASLRDALLAQRNNTE